MFNIKIVWFIIMHDVQQKWSNFHGIVIIHQSLLNIIFTTKLYILMKKINYKQR
jgi:hypothetical protein